MHREVDEDGSADVEESEDVKVGREPEMVGKSRRDKPPDQVARYIAGDIGSKRAGAVGGAVLLAKVGERESECRSHEEALHDPKEGKDAEPGSSGQQRRRNCEQRQAQE